MIASMDISNLVPRLAATIGPQDGWKTSFRQEDADTAERVCDRLVELFSSSEEKKIKKAALDCGAFEQLSLCVRKYVEQPVVLVKAILALQAFCRNASSKVQKAAPLELFQSFIPAMRRLNDPVVRAVQDLTRNNKETTKFAMRSGWEVDLLAEDSSVRVTESGKVLED